MSGHKRQKTAAERFSQIVATTRWSPAKSGH